MKKNYYFYENLVVSFSNIQTQYINLVCNQTLVWLTAHNLKWPLICHWMESVALLVSKSLALLVTQLTCYLHFGQDILKSPVIILLNEEATARKVPCWLDPQRPESQLPVDTEKFNKRWPCKADHICTINSLIITPIYVYSALSCRFLWYHKWASETSLSLQTLQQSNRSIVGVPSAKGLYLLTPNT